MNTLTHTDPEYKHLIDYIYKNLVDQTVKYGKTSKSYVSKDEQIAIVAASSRWKKDPSKAVDDAGMFIATKQNYIRFLVDQEGLTVASFSHIVDGRWTGRDGAAKGLCRAFINYMINQYHHEHGYQQSFESRTVYLESEKLQAITNVWEDKMISEIEEKNNENEIEMSIERFRIKAQALFIDTLTDDEVVVFHYWACSKRDAAAVEAAIKPLAISRRTLFNRLPNMVERYEAFVTNLLER